jgi:hypothetical protein
MVMNIPIYFLPILIIFVMYVLIKYLEKTKAEKILKNYSKQEIKAFSSNVNFFGIKSQGMTQIRGNGALLLTKEYLYFQMWIPKKEIKIPLDKIENIEEVKSFLGKSKFRPLLKINYIDENGQKNSAAWMVKNLEKWKEIINETR